MNRQSSSHWKWLSSMNIPHLHLPTSRTASSRRQLHMWQCLLECDGRSRFVGLPPSASSSASLLRFLCRISHVQAAAVLLTQCSTYRNRVEIEMTGGRLYFYEGRKYVRDQNKLQHWSQNKRFTLHHGKFTKWRQSGNGRELVKKTKYGDRFGRNKKEIHGERWG